MTTLLYHDASWPYIHQPWQRVTWTINASCSRHYRNTLRCDIKHFFQLTPALFRQLWIRNFLASHPTSQPSWLLLVLPKSLIIAASSFVLAFSADSLDFYLVLNKQAHRTQRKQLHIKTTQRLYDLRGANWNTRVEKYFHSAICRSPAESLNINRSSDEDFRLLNVYLIPILRRLSSLLVVVAIYIRSLVKQEEKEILMHQVFQRSRCEKLTRNHFPAEEANEKFIVYGFISELSLLADLNSPCLSQSTSK